MAGHAATERRCQLPSDGERSEIDAYIPELVACSGDRKDRSNIFQYHNGKLPACHLVLMLFIGASL